MCEFYDSKLINNCVHGKFKIKNNKILVIAAHPDDEILGCGGTINKLKNSNTFKIVFLTNGVFARSKNKKKSKYKKK